MTTRRRSSRAVAAVLVAAAALGLTACAQGAISEDRMLEIRQPLSDAFRETVVGLGAEGWDDAELLTRTSWCRHLDDNAGSLSLHRFDELFRIDNETLSGAEIEAIATRIFEDNGLVTETVLDEESMQVKTTISGRIYDDPNSESVGLVQVWYWGDSRSVGPDISVHAETACAPGEKIIDLEE